MKLLSSIYAMYRLLMPKKEHYKVQENRLHGDALIEFWKNQGQR